MKYITSLATLLFLQACIIGAGENSKIEENKEGYFPKVTGINLHGESKELPTSFDKKLNIVTIAFKREQQKEVNTWIVVADEILRRNPDIGFFEIPLIYEIGMFKRTWVNNGMRFGIPNEKARTRTITVYTQREKFFEMMEMEKNKIYTLLLNKDGKILWRTEGIATDLEAELLKKKIRKFR